MTAENKPTEVRAVGRYLLFEEIAAGGMATVHVGRLRGPAGFSRTVAIKRLHAHFAKDPEFVSMFLDEAQLASRIQHPNVVATLDVVALSGELFLVMEFIQGESLSTLFKLCAFDKEKMPVPIAVGVIAGVLYGLHAAHEARGERGVPLDIIHRDVSPQNVLVGTDGIARVLDFGVAKAAWRTHTTRDGQIKGKLRYMAPEQFSGSTIDRRADVFSASVVLWELLSGQRLFAGEEPRVFVERLFLGEVQSVRKFNPDVSPELDAIVLRGLDPRREKRFATAREMAVALETAVTPATAREIGEWVERMAGDRLRGRAARIAQIESDTPSGADAAEVGPAVAAAVAEAEGVRRRAQMPTLQESSSGVSKPIRSEVASAQDASPPSPRRARRVSLVAALILFAGGVWWLSSRQSVALSEPPRAAVSVVPEPTQSEPAPVASLSTATADPSSAQSSVPPPRAAGNVTGNAKRRTSTPAPAASKPGAGLCMKQRPDGVVYFEPCR